MTHDSIPQNTPDYSKRYWLFGYPEYEASGGMSDLLASYDTVEQAKASLDEWHEKRSLDYIQIFDSETRKELEYWNYYQGWFDA